MTVTIAALALSLFVSGPSHANEAMTAVPIFGSDSIKLDCVSWEALRLHRSSKTDVIEAWAFGYATAYVSSHASWPGLPQFTTQQLLPLIDDQCSPDFHNNYAWAAIEAALKPVLAQADVK